MEVKKFLKILKRVKLKSREQVFWEKQIKIEERFEVKFKNRMVKIFNRQKKEVLRKLTGKKAISIPKVSLNPKKESKEFGIVLPPVIREIIKEEGNLAYSQIGIDDTIDLDEARVLNYLERKFLKS